MRRNLSSKVSLAVTALALIASACADPAAGPRSLEPGRALGDNVAVLPGQPAGTTAIPLVSNASTHWCGFNATVAPVVGTFAGTDCATAAVDLTVPLTTYNPGWSAPLAGSSWIGPVVTGGTSNEYRTLPGTYEFIRTFTIPALSTNPSLQLSVKSDNAVLVYLNGTKIGGNAVISDCTSAPCNWNININMNNAPAVFVIGGSNTLRVDLVNTRIGFPATDNCALGPQPSPPPAGHFDAPYNAATCPNPAAVDFAGAAYYTAFVRPVALFVIGDVEAHGIGTSVNFWGPQWWKNNQLSGTVDNGHESFKGYATLSDDVCGGKWVSLPGNSSNPPAFIGTDIAIIVTSSVLKDGANLSGDIKEIVIVHQDGLYRPSVGHDGNGPVTSVVCTTP